MMKDRQMPIRRVLLLLPLIAALFCPELSASQAENAPNSADPRVILLGFDGIDPELAQRFIEEGELPNLKKLADEGGFQPLQTMYPAQSPVCWASALTGKNPGKHGVVGFVRRTPGSYSPELGVIRVETQRPLYGVWGRAGVISAILLIFFVGFRMLGKRLNKPQVTKMGVFLGVVISGIAFFLIYHIPMEVPQPVNARQGETFFEQVASAGHKVASLNTPMDWPVPPRENTLEYAGFNVPDLRGTFGIYSYYTTAYQASAAGKSEMGGDIYRLEFEPLNLKQRGLMPLERHLENCVSATIAHTTFRGVRDVTKAQEGYPTQKLPLTLIRARYSNGTTKLLTVFGESGGDRIGTVEAGKWSDWQTLKFRLNPVIHVAGRVRFYCDSIEPELRLYATPLQFDPYAPMGNHELSHPREFFTQEEEAIGGGGLDTLGWPELTHPSYDENLSDRVFMDHLMDLEGKRYTILRRVLERQDRDLVCAYFFGSDRVQHLMWRYMDENNTNFEAIKDGPEANAVLEIYRFMDRVVGQVLKDHCGNNTLLMVVSDHGFAPFRKAVSVNRWLIDKGYLVMKQSQTKRHASDMFDKDARKALLREVDWSRTRAYAMGLGKIFLNIKGREPEGTVDPKNAKDLALEIRAEFESLRDEDDNPVVSRVILREEIVHGPYAKEMADLLVGFHPGYRVSWQTTLGFGDEPVIFENDKRWSGDHCSIDSALLPGVIFANRRLLGTEISLMDLAPTVLREFDLPIDEDIDGKPIAFATSSH